MDLQKVLIVYKSENKSNNSHSENNKKEKNIHKIIVDSIVKILNKKNINFDIVERNSLKLIENYDLVITSGGDGTILDTSKFVKEIPLLGVNSAPDKSVGFFTGATKDSFENIINLILNDKIARTNLLRVQLKLNGKSIKELALNDILVTNNIPAATFKYEIKLKDKKEIHKSSGIWISTPAGSTAGIRSAGGKTMPIDSEQIQYLIREFYDGGKKGFTLLGSIINFQDGLEITSQSDSGLFFIDGHYFNYPFLNGDKLTFYKSEFPLTILGIDEDKRLPFLN